MMQASETGPPPLGTFWILDLDRSSRVSLAPRVPTTFQRVGAEAAPSLAQAMGLDDPAVVLQRFARGCRCYVGKVEGVLATYGWVTFDEEEIGELGLRIHLRPGEAYIWNCATLPKYRGLRLYSALLAHIVNELSAAGLHRVWIGADNDNVVSQKGMVLAGFQPVADIVLTRALAIRRLWVRGRPGVPEQLLADIRRALFGNINLEVPHS